MQNESVKVVRENLEKEGIVLSESEFNTVLEYTKRKMGLAKKEASYLVILLESEIRDYFFRNTITAASVMMMA